MAKFVNNILRLTDRLYNFVGGERHESVLDLRTPIIRVHDLSREAELGTFDGIFGGLTSNVSPFFTINVDNVHGAGTTVINARIGIYSNQSPTWRLATWSPPDPELETVWLYMLSASSANALVTTAFVQNSMDPKAGAGAGFAPRMMVWEASSLTTPQDTDLNHQLKEGGAPRGPPFPIPISNKLLNNTPLEFTSRATGADVCDFFAFCMRLPNGVFPPGFR